MKKVEAKRSSAQPAVSEAKKVHGFEKATEQSAYQGTMEHDVFQHIKGNRPINKHHLNALIEKVKKKNLLHLYPIVVNQAFEVLDGQHRLAAAKHLGLMVYFVEGEKADNLTVQDVQETNSVQKSWSCKDRLDSFCETMNEEYIMLRSFCTQFGVHITVAQTLLGGKRRNNKEFANGRFKVTNYMKATEVMETVDQIAALTPHFKANKERGFILALNDLFRHPQFKASVLIQKVTMLSNRLTKRVSQAEYRALLEELYNYKNQSPITFKESVIES